MTKRILLAVRWHSIFMSFAVVAFFATSAFAQDTAHIPFKFNVDVIVTATQGERVITQEFKANTLDTLRLHLGTTPLLSQGTVSKPVTMHNSRGKLSLELSPQFYRNTEISIYTLSGKRVLHDRVEAAKNISNLNLATGVYLLHIKGGSSAFSTRVAHQGGGMNIEVGFGSVSSLNKEHLGVWTINVTAKDRTNHLDLTYTITAETGVHATHTINSNGYSFSRNTGGGTPVVTPPVTQPDNTVRMVCNNNPTDPIPAKNFTSSNIKCWVGEGNNNAILIFKWNDGKTPEALAWGYRWSSGTKYGINILADVAKADGRLFFLEQSGTQFGSAIGGVGYEASGSANAKLSSDGGKSCVSPVNGSLATSGYDYDDWKLCDVSKDARFQAGWYNGYWSYWVADVAGGEWSYSSLGASSRELKNNSVDAWYFSPLGGSETNIGDTDCRGRDCFVNITPAGAPVNAPIITPSSSSVVIVTPSSSSGNPGSSSSSSVESCEGFEDGTEREHYGNKKKQFCDIRDGKKYVYVDIGEQTWMAENVNYFGEDGNLGRCFRDNPENCKTLGRMYSFNDMFCKNENECKQLRWGVTDPNSINGANIVCPIGWHLPSTTELEALFTYSDHNFAPGSEGSGRGSGNSAATKLKVKDWGGTDELGFSGLPGGFCGGGCSAWYTSYPGGVTDPIKSTFWWSHAYGAPVPLVKSWHMETGSARVDDAFQSQANSVFYTRCVQDKTPSPKTPEPAPQSLSCSGSGTEGQVCHYGKWKDYFIDGRDENDIKEYPFVIIGSKSWMAENLNYSKGGIGKCYNDLDGNCKIYGRLYNSAEANAACPDKWRLPTDAEWTELATAVGGAALKLKAKSGWSNIMSTDGTYGTDGITDELGFAALPGGYGNLRAGNYGSILSFGSARGGFWWSSKSVAANGSGTRHIGPTLATITSVDNDNSRLYSVRCVSEENFCGGKPYEKTTHFCQEGKEIMPLCNGKQYSSSEFCQEGTKEVRPLCGTENGYTSEFVCQNNEVVRADCSDFIDGTKRTHYGQEKEQFCDKRDGNRYVYVEKNGYLWMADNLNYKAPNTTDINSKCYGDATGGDSQKNCEKYGRLYTREAAAETDEAKKICPKDWHLPNGAEWDALLGKGNAYELKTAEGWNNGGGGVDLPPGFSALPGGWIQDLKSDQTGNSPSFELGSYGYWWSADENVSFYRKMSSSNHTVTNNKNTSNNDQRILYSVRCVNDKPKCNGVDWDPQTGVCEGTTVEVKERCGDKFYDKLTQFCYKDSKVGEKCGDRMEIYDPDLYECGTANRNWIYLKEKPRDAKGNEYKAVLIGEQTWITENLKLDVEGSQLNSNGSKNNCETYGYCDMYGRLYSQNTAMAGNPFSTSVPSGVQGICPEGWHIPSRLEWEKLKSTAKSTIELRAVGVWDAANAIIGKGIDSYGFTALTDAAGWWSTVQNNAYGISLNNTGVLVETQSNQLAGATRGVRCLKN
jgi:uncharacterized protein (TIGR02145 family)